MNLLFFLTPKQDVLYIYEDFTLRQTLEKWSNQRYATIPVLKRNGEYVGSITEGDILWGMKNLHGLDLDCLLYTSHRRHDIFPSYPVGEELRRPLKERLYLLWRFPLEKLRAGCYQRIDKPCAVLAGSAPGLFNAVLNEMIVPAFRPDDMEVVFAPAGVNVGVAGVLLFLPFVMGFQRSCRIALVFFKSQNCVLCHETPFPVPFLSGTFSQENPAENISDRIGMDKI